MDEIGVNELFLLLDRAQRQNAKAWVAVAIDDTLGEAVCVTGPFATPEDALLAGSSDERAWRDDHELEVRHVVLPLWGPGE